ncbi:hypothetical protein SELMODRAFT_120595, partial [Selaginella moellendorffii]
ITVLTGAGISAESGVPTFKEWREWSAMLTTPEAFAANPSMVWEFYHYRRCIVSKAVPNAGHYAITALEKRCEQQGKEFKLLTQNVDGLHSRAGTKSVEELHGSMWKTRCCTCDQVLQNFDMPICAALDGKGCPDPSAYDANIPRLQLPRCRSCNGLLRPHVVWFGESLDLGVMERAHESLRRCDLLLVAGTSAVVQPAAGFIPLVKGGGGAVAEFNLEETPATRYCRQVLSSFSVSLFLFCLPSRFLKQSLCSLNLRCLSFHS